LASAGDFQTFRGPSDVAKLKQALGQVLGYGPASALVDLLEGVKFVMREIFV
jgi:hypothetical protein